MPPILHIGPPKTATKSLQGNIIPYLGLPYTIKPGWTDRMARVENFSCDETFAANVIVSCEKLGDFAAFPPEVIASRLAALFPAAIVIYVVREPLELFYSYYRQSLINGASLLERWAAKVGRYLAPGTADQYFDLEWKRLQKNDVGFFVMADADRVQSAFSRYFTFHRLDFGDVKSNPQKFVAAFTALCGRELDMPLGHLNATNQGKLETSLTLLPKDVPPELRDQMQELYETCKLSPDREAFLQRWPSSKQRCAKASLRTAPLGPAGDR